jgi:acetate CoA/acetoacetate CoA-transferase beta subunit
MVGGFMSVGTPEWIVNELARQGKRDLTVLVMQHSAKRRPKIVKRCTLPLTSVRPVDLVVTEMAVIAFPAGRATLMETAPGVTVDRVRSETPAVLAAQDTVPSMPIQ